MMLQKPEVNFKSQLVLEMATGRRRPRYVILSNIIYLDSMTLSDQSQTEVRRMTTSLTKPKVNVNIGCWNVRTLYSIGKSTQLAREMDKYKIDVMGISECRWMGHGKVKMNTGESVIFSGREDNIHRHGVAIMMTKKTEQALIEWKPIIELFMLDSSPGM